MKKLTDNQIKLLPTLRDIYHAKNTKKSLVLVALIDDYLAKKEQTKTELDAIKIAVQLYQAEQKQERMKQRQQHINSKQRSQENRNLTREKIILGACEMVALKNDGRPFFNFLLALWHGYVSDTDLKFMSERYKISNAKSIDGFKMLRMWTNDNMFYLCDWQANRDGKFKFSYGIKNADGTQSINSFVLKTYDHDPRTRYGN